MISEVLIVLLIGEYTEFPAWLPADPGSWYCTVQQYWRRRAICEHGSSYIIRLFFCADGYGGFYALDWGSSGAINTFYSRRQKFLFCWTSSIWSARQLPSFVFRQNIKSTFQIMTLVHSPLYQITTVIWKLFKHCIFMGWTGKIPAKRFSHSLLPIIAKRTGTILPQILEATVYIGLTFKRTGVWNGISNSHISNYLAAVGPVTWIFIQIPDSCTSAPNWVIKFHALF